MPDKSILTSAPGGILDISLSILILCLFPVVIAVISHLRGVEIVSLIQWLCIIFVLIGLSLLILSDKSSISFLGIFFSLIGMIFAVIITFLSEKMTKEIGALTTTFYLNAWGLLFLLLILTSFSNYLPPQSNMGWFAMALNGVFNIGAWVFFFRWYAENRSNQSFDAYVSRSNFFSYSSLPAFQSIFFNPTMGWIFFGYNIFILL